MEPQQVDYTHKQISWKKLLGNPFRRGLFPELLYGTAVRAFQGKTKGMSKTELDIFLAVTFDDEYLVQFLVNKIFRPLQVGEHRRLNLLQKAIGKAYRKYQKEIELSETEQDDD